MLNFSFLEKGLELVSPPNFVYGFSRKMFFMLYSLNWPNLIARLSLFLTIFGNTYITIVCLPVWDVINFEINLIFLIKPFCYKTKKSRKNLISWERKELLRWNKKHFSSILKGFQLSKLSHTWECIFKIVC